MFEEAKAPGWGPQLSFCIAERFFLLPQASYKTPASWTSVPSRCKAASDSHAECSHTVHCRPEIVGLILKSRAMARPKVFPPPPPPGMKALEP